VGLDAVTLEKDDDSSPQATLSGVGLDAVTLEKDDDSPPRTTLRFLLALLRRWRSVAPLVRSSCAQQCFGALAHLRFSLAAPVCGWRRIPSQTVRFGEPPPFPA